MTGFALLIWIFLVCCIEHSLRSRIAALEKIVEELRAERRVVLSDDIDKLQWTELPLAPGTCLIDSEGVYEKDSIFVMTYKAKKQKATGRAA